MKKSIAVLTFSILFCLPLKTTGQACMPAKHAKLPLIINMTYHRARPRLLAAGWQPHPTIHHNEASKNPATSYGNGEIFWKKGYWEIEDCAGTGLAPCIFLFEDVYGNRLRVSTAGEEYPRQKIFAKVTGYKFVCGEDE